jgi:hypothetical protein
MGNDRGYFSMDTNLKISMVHLVKLIPDLLAPYALHKLLYLFQLFVIKIISGDDTITTHQPNLII